MELGIASTATESLKGLARTREYLNLSTTGTPGGLSRQYIRFLRAGVQALTQSEGPKEANESSTLQMGNQSHSRICPTNTSFGLMINADLLITSKSP